MQHPPQETLSLLNGPIGLQDGTEFLKDRNLRPHSGADPYGFCFAALESNARCVTKSF